MLTQRCLLSLELQERWTTKRSDAVFCFFNLIINAQILISSPKLLTLVAVPFISSPCLLLQPHFVPLSFHTLHSSHTGLRNIFTVYYFLCQICTIAGHLYLLFYSLREFQGWLILVNSGLWLTSQLSEESYLTISEKSCTPPCQSILKSSQSHFPVLHGTSNAICWGWKGGKCFESNMRFK